MNEIDKALTNLQDAILEDELMRRFYRAKSLIAEEPFLIESEARLKELQKHITNNVLNPQKHALFLAEYEALVKEYDNHPYVLNFNALLDEVNNLFYHIKKIIE